MKITQKHIEYLIQKLNKIEDSVLKIREEDIPNLKVEVAIVKEKASNSAKIITGIGGLIAIATSTAIAWFRK